MSHSSYLLALIKPPRTLAIYRTMVNRSFKNLRNLNLNLIEMGTQTMFLSSTTFPNQIWLQRDSSHWWKSAEDTHAITWWKSERSFWVACRYRIVLACLLNSPSHEVLPVCRRKKRRNCSSLPDLLLFILPPLFYALSGFCSHFCFAQFTWCWRIS